MNDDAPVFKTFRVFGWLPDLLENVHKKMKLH